MLIELMTIPPNVVGWSVVSLMEFWSYEEENVACALVSVRCEMQCSLRVVIIVIEGR